MRKIRLDAAARDAFLADRRLGVLALHDEHGAPVGVPLWYGWDGVEIDPELGQEAAARLAERYLLDARAVAARIGQLRKGELVRLSFVPERIRSHAEIE